jgi:hypothetical protein
MATSNMVNKTLVDFAQVKNFRVMYFLPRFLFPPVVSFDAQNIRCGLGANACFKGISSSVAMQERVFINRRPGLVAKKPSNPS